ncbi:ankyrin repeat-containing domain protein, partial [Phycomyces nitens]
LVRQGANTNAKDNSGWTPLHEAARSGHLTIVKLLLDHGGDINTLGHLANTPLHYASIHSHPNVVNHLIEAGADIDLTNDEGKTAYEACDSPKVRRILASRIDELRKQ